MSFSPNQQPELRVLVALAWQAHVRRERLPPESNMDPDWYERELFHATGHTSIAQCDKEDDHNRAMAHFEALASAGTRWQLHLHSADLQQMLRELIRDFGAHVLQRCQADETRLLKALHSSLGARPLWKIPRDEFIAILREVKRSIRRSIKHDIYTQDEKAEALGFWQQNGIWARPA